MKLFEHADFEQVVFAAAEHYRHRGWRPALIEKDYYVTEALRMIAGTVGDKVIFKGGTSLSKGWNLIGRFSEDIDIFLDPQAFEPALNARGIDRTLKMLRDSIAEHPALTFVKEGSRTIGGFGRRHYYDLFQLSERREVREMLISERIRRHQARLRCGEHDTFSGQLLPA